MAKVEPTNGNVVEVQSDDDSVIDRERNDAGSETVRVKNPEAQLLTTQGSYLGKGLAKTDSYFGDQAEDAPAFYTYVYRNLNARYVTIVLCGLYALQLLLVPPRCLPLSFRLPGCLCQRVLELPLLARHCLPLLISKLPHPLVCSLTLPLFAQ